MTHARPYLAMALAILGLGASAAAMADTFAATPAWCAASGCAAVRATGWSHPLGVPLPVIGVAFFATMLMLCVTDAGRLRRIAAIGGAAVALGLIAVQAFVIDAWCQVCLVSDGAALALAATILTARSWPRPTRAVLAGALALGALAIAAPIALRGDDVPPVPVPGDLPAVIAREQTAGAITVVDFVDFECPFCRALHARLVQAVAQAGVPVRVVRKMVPLARHAGALPAAIAWCCAERQGKGDAMAEALLAAPIADLTAEGCEQLAAMLGLDLARYRADAASAEVRARIDRDLADARAAGVQLLPTLYIGERPFVGAAATVDELVAALRRS